WIGGNGDGVFQKWSHDGSTKLLQIGTKFLCDNPPTNACAGDSAVTGSSHTLLNRPADLAVDPLNGDVYIADGYGNHRVVVFDKNGNYLRQMGGTGTGPGQFAFVGGGHPHCVVLGKDGLVYACDRGNDRLNVLHKMAIDSKGNLYAGETVGGRRIQKFTRASNCPGNSEGHGNAGLYQCPGNSGH